MNNVFFYQPEQSKLASYEHVAITYLYSDGNILPQKKCEILNSDFKKIMNLQAIHKLAYCLLYVLPSICKPAYFLSNNKPNYLAKDPLLILIWLLTM